MSTDPYVQLGVAPDAGDAEIKAAYEKAITAAARAGHLETAKRIDAAYEVLRNPSRRAFFDRTGVVRDLPRPDPDASYFATPAVPWRTWSPPERGAGGRARQRSRRRLMPLLGTAVLVGAIAAVNLSAMRHGGASTLGSGFGGNPRAAVGGAPPVVVHAHPQRLRPPVSPPSAAGTYVFQSHHGDSLVRWDPCQPIRYVISGTEPFTGANQMLKQALNEAGAASGLEFAFAGTSTEVPSTNRPSYQPDRYARTWAPVLVGWTDRNVVPELGARAIGLGGSSAARVHGRWQLVSGLLYFDAPQMALDAIRPDGYALMRQVMLHETGHLLGLGHVSDPTQIMYPADSGVGGYAAGDLHGLAVAGGGSCSHYS